MIDITIHPHSTVKEAMEALDRTAKKVLLVINDIDALIGTLTDGDIRRHILRGDDLNGTIENAFCPNPIYVLKEEFDLEEVKKLFMSNGINLIPLLDRERKVVDSISWEKAFGNSKNRGNNMAEVPVVIMAGGRGTRLEPFTKVLPKPLVPVGEKPVVDHIIDRFLACGARQFYITVHHMSKILRAYFEEKSPEYSIDFVEESEPRGTAGSLNVLRGKLRTSFFVSNCDIIIENDYSDIYAFHIHGGYDITLVASAKEFKIPYGICELNAEGSLGLIREKPQQSFLVNTGLYVLTPNVVDLIPDSGSFHITDLMQSVKKQEGKVGVYPVSESAWIDVGQWGEYRKALRHFEGV